MAYTYIQLTYLVFRDLPFSFTPNKWSACKQIDHYLAPTPLAVPSYVRGPVVCSSQQYWSLIGQSIIQSQASSWTMFGISSLIQINYYYCYYYYYCYNHFTAPWTLSGTTQVSQYQKGKTNLDLLQQEMVSGNGISWATCRSASRPYRWPYQNPTTQFLTGRMPFLLPNQQCQSIEHTHTQPFYGSVEFVRENTGEPVPEEAFTHYSHRSHQSSLSAFSI